MPQFIAIDEGREFRAGFAKLSASAGAVVFRSAARAPWQQGRVERHGGLIKEMIEKCREEMPPTTMSELAHLMNSCEAAKNRFSNRSGYSPTQRQIGQWPRMPSSLMSDEEIDPSLQSQACADDFQKLMEMRRIAQSAFMKMELSGGCGKGFEGEASSYESFFGWGLGLCLQIPEEKEDDSWRSCSERRRNWKKSFLGWSRVCLGS